jgi:hypothetical protein
MSPVSNHDDDDLPVAGGVPSPSKSYGYASKCPSKATSSLPSIKVSELENDVGDQTHFVKRSDSRLAKKLSDPYP